MSKEHHEEEAILVCRRFPAPLGPQVLDTVAARAAEMAEKMNESPMIPCTIVYKATVKTCEEITALIKEANYDDSFCGAITWCHFATQYNRKILNEEIDMDFMNLNQAAHGDREHGFIGARLRRPRKIMMGYWQDEEPQPPVSYFLKKSVQFEDERFIVQWEQMVELQWECRGMT